MKQYIKPFVKIFITVITLISTSFGIDYAASLISSPSTIGFFSGMGLMMVIPFIVFIILIKLFRKK